MKARGLPILGRAAAAVVVLALLSAGCGGAHGRQRSVDVIKTPAIDLVVFGITGSDVAEREVQLGHLRNVVIPKAVADSARLMVGLVSDKSATQPQVIADVSFDVKAQAGGNPVSAESLAHKRTEELIGQVSDQVARIKPSPASDPFGAVAWAETVLAQFPTPRKLLVVLTDSVATVPGCQLTARDLSPAYRDAVLADCTHGHTPQLGGVEVWQGGAGLALGEPLPDPIAFAIEDLWRAFWLTTGARLTRYGPTLVGAVPSGERGR